MRYEDKPRGRSPAIVAARDAEIRRLRSQGHSYSEIALRLNLSDKTVRRVLARQPE